MYMGKRQEMARKGALVRDLIDDNQYIEALQILDEMDLEAVESTADLNLFADLYEKAERIDKKKDIYYILYKRNHSRYVLNRLLRLVLRMGDMELEQRATQVLHDMDIDAALEVASDITEELSRHGDINVNLVSLRTSSDYTYKHSLNVAILSVLIGIGMGMRQSALKELATAGLLHDIGKVQVPPEILEKPGPLTETEFDVIKMHSKNGYEKLKNNVLVTSKIKMGVYMHHENINGTGYPMGLEGEQIYKFARIIHVADVYDAITSRRVYKKAQSPNEAVDFLIRNSGAMFDPECVKAFVTYIPVYPKGRNVILSDGEVAVVVENRQQHTLYPVVRRLSNGETLDLSLHEIPNLKILGFQDI